MPTPTTAAPTGHLLQTIGGILDFADEHAGHAFSQQLLQDLTLECIRRGTHDSRREILALAIAGCAASAVILAAATSTPDQSKP